MHKNIFDEVNWIPKDDVVLKDFIYDILFEDSEFFSFSKNYYNLLS